MFNNKLSVFLCAFLALTGLFSFSAKSECTKSSSLSTVSFVPINVTPSDRGAAGTVLYSVSVSVPPINYTCGTVVKTTWKSTFSRPEMIKSAINNVYETNVPGIGIRIRWPASRGDNAWIPGAYSCQGNCTEPADKVLLEIVQTGNAISGTIPAGRLATIDLSADSAPQNTINLLNIDIGTITVNVRSCAIYASNNSVDLGSYSLVDIQKTGFVGAQKDFTITLDCPEQTSAKITFEGKNAWGMSSSVLENTGTAQNAYIKLYQKSGQRYTAKALNKQASFGSAASFSGTRSVTYAGQMYFDNSTRANATAGTVSANVIYTLTIQ